MLDTHFSLRDGGAALAAWAARRQAFPRAARQCAQRAFVDVIGCMAAGSADPATTAVRDACAAWGTGAATVIGAGHHQAAPWAALINGTAAHALDFDDNFEPARAHITAVLGAALLARAEEQGASGAAVINAYIVGTEIAARLGGMMNPRHRESGWHATGTIGPVAAAAACAHLLGLDAPATAHALNAAASFAGGTMAQFGTGMKAVHAGRAAAAGIMAAQFAAAGLDAGTGALDGRYGLDRMMAGAGNAMAATDELALITHGLKVKPYPCCASVHRAIDGVLDLRAAHGLRADTLARITVHLPAAHLANLMFDTPTSPREARFSLPYCVALAIVRGDVTLADFAPAHLHDPGIRRAMACVEAKPLPGAGESTRVEIVVADGRVFETLVSIPRGHKDRPLTDEALWAKFRACCEGVVDAARVRDLERALGDFDSDAPAANLMKPLAG